MATLAEAMFQSASRTATESQPDINKAITQGAELALKKQQIDTQRMQIEEQRKSLQVNKHKQMMDTFKLFEKTPDPKLRKMLAKEILPRKAKSLGLTDIWTQPVMDAAANSVDFMQKVKGLEIMLESRIQAGELTPEEATAEFNTRIKDPEGILSLDTERFAEAGEFAKSKEIQKQEAESRMKLAEAQFEATRTERELAREERKSAKFETNKQKLSDDLEKVGMVDMETNLRELNEAIPGGIMGWDGKADIPGVGGFEGKKPIGLLNNPEAKKVRQLAQGVVNAILKARSGGAVSDGEAQRLLSEMGWDMAFGEGGGVTTLFKGSRTDAEFMKGLQGAVQKLKQKQLQYKQAYGDEVWGEVRKGAKTIITLPPNFQNKLKGVIKEASKVSDIETIKNEIKRIAPKLDAVEIQQLIDEAL